MFVQIRGGLPPKMFDPAAGSIEMCNSPLTAEQARQLCYDAISVDDQRLLEYYQELHSTVEVKGIGWFGIHFSLGHGGVSGVFQNHQAPPPGVEDEYPPRPRTGENDLGSGHSSDGGCPAPVHPMPPQRTGADAKGIPESEWADYDPTRW